MEKKDYIRNYINQFINPNSECLHETITRYVGVNKIKIYENKKEIIDFFRANFWISGSIITYDDLRYDSYNNEWIKLYSKRDLDLFENLIAIGYEAEIFEDSVKARMVNAQMLERSEMKYCLPDEFEYLDEEYYIGLNEGAIKKNCLIINTDVFYESLERTVETSTLLEYWFLSNNVPQARECKYFYYMLEHKEEALLNVATYLTMKGLEPFYLLLDLDKMINCNIVGVVQNVLDNCDTKTKKDFYRMRDTFLNMLEISYKAAIIKKKKER